jgi:hypothetical protein
MPTASLARWGRFCPKPTELARNTGRLLSGMTLSVSAMLQLNALNQRIARLELRIEQLRIHLLSLVRASSEATEVRSMLYGMLRGLVGLKEEREQLEALLELDEVA